ncbi:MAG: hypothetical protein D6799_06860 [Bacteroidetes bacterium]|jgi:DNA/RNA endonuclease YhcR with UshA esterase domain|nr:MAG: hypothetical protein D6799_06860 [Bacteroidota bacterium]
MKKHLASLLLSSVLLSFHHPTDLKINSIIEQQDEPIISACNAYAHIGKHAIVQGKVVSTYRSAKGNIFLNFEQPYPNQCFTAVIFSNALQNFGGHFNEKQFAGKIVQVSGFIKQYKGKPEIIVNYPEQLSILK